MGKQYLIHAYRGTGGPWSTIICAGNRLARDAAVFLSQVRAQRRGDKGASLYGVLRRVQQPLYPAWTNSVRGWARGFQVFVQRRAANNLNGWVAYAYGRTYARDGVTGSAFDADYDQRHSVRVYGSYRLKPTINLSGKWIWATGLPVRGFFAQASPEEAVLSTQRNQLRLPAYRRVDFGINKAFLRRWGSLRCLLKPST